MAWKYTWSSKDTWFGPTENAGWIGARYNLTMDPYGKYDMIFNGAAASRFPKASPGQYAGMDNRRVLSLFCPAIIDFRQVRREVSEHKTIRRPRLERDPAESSASGNLVPLMDLNKPVHAISLPN